jgi:predicted outer membrane repeat protein
VVAVADHDSLAGGDFEEAVFRGNEAGEGGGAVAGNLISTKGSKQVSDVPVFGQVTCALRDDRPKYVAACRKSDSRGPLNFIAVRSQNDDKRNLACA